MCGRGLSLVVVMVGIAGYAAAIRQSSNQPRNPSYQPRYTSYQPRYRVYQPRYRAYYSGNGMRDNRAEEPAADLPTSLGPGQEENTTEKLPGIEGERKEMAHQIVVKQSVHQNVDHYHILVDKEEQSNEKMIEAQEVTTEAVVDAEMTTDKEGEKKGKNKPNISFNIWGNKEVNLNQGGDRVYNIKKGDTVHNYGPNKEAEYPDSYDEYQYYY